MAPDEKIYINLPQALKLLHVINNPNKEGSSCNIEQHSIKLPTYNAFSLPNFPNYRLGAIEDYSCDSMEVNTSFITNKTSVLELFPNPSNKEVAIELTNSEKSRLIKWRAIDITGKLSLEGVFVNNMINVLE